MSKLLPLSGKRGQGKFAIVDDDDYKYFSRHCWTCDISGYAVRGTSIKSKKVVVFMHRLINHTPKHLYTDHINGNKLDNRKDNLRTCSFSENKRNGNIYKNNTSGYKGVSFDISKVGKSKPWKAHISSEKRKICLGCFATAKAAALAYNKAAKKYYGEFAKLNKI